MKVKNRKDKEEKEGTMGKREEITTQVFSYEKKKRVPATVQPGGYCENLLLLEKDGMSVVGAPKINPSLGLDPLETTKTKNKFLQTTRFDPRTCKERCPKLLMGRKEKTIETEDNLEERPKVGLHKKARTKSVKEVSVLLGFIETIPDYTSDINGNESEVQTESDSVVGKIDLNVPSGLTVHPGIYSSRHTADKKKPEQARPKARKKTKNTPHFVQERIEELDRWTKWEENEEHVKKEEKGFEKGETAEEKEKVEKDKVENEEKEEKVERETISEELEKEETAEEEEKVEKEKIEKVEREKIEKEEKLEKEEKVYSFMDEPKAQCTENDLEQVFSSDPICFWHFYLTLLQSGTGVQHNKWNPVQVFTLVLLLHLVQLAQPTTTANSARIPINCGIKPNADGCCHC